MPETRIKVLYVIEGNGGGAITHALSLAQGLNPQEFSASTVFFLDGPSVSFAKERGLHCQLIPRKFDLDFMLAWKIAHIIRQEKITLIHTHTITGNFYARWAALITFLTTSKRPVLLTTVHSFVIDELKGNTTISFRDWFRYRRDLYGHRFTEHFITVSPQLKQKMITLGIADNRIIAIPNGVEIPDLSVNKQNKAMVEQEFQLADDDTLIGIAGRLVPLKNHSFFLEIADQLLAKYDKLKFIIIGDGPLLAEAKRTCQKLGIADRVIFTGWRNDVLTLISALDIYVLTSVVEGLNLSILEAMAAGKPVVGTDTKGIADLVEHEKTGLLYKLDDLSGFVAGLSRIITDKEFGKRLGAEGRRITQQQYALATTISKNEMIYKKCVHTHQ